jgi:hypothetical protein
MAALGTLMAPAMTYGTGGTLYCANSDSNITTGGGTYRIERWNACDSTTAVTDWGWDTGSATNAVTVEYRTIPLTFRTFDSPWVQTYPTGGQIRFRTDTDDTIYYYWNWTDYVIQPKKTPAERLKEILNSRMAPSVLSNCRPLGLTKDIREIRARETLLRVLGETKYRDFVRRGFISVRAKSGLVYQIFPGHDFTKVYDCGKMIDRLCVVLNGDFPPTDSLIMRYLMILNNEQQFRSYAIRHGAIRPELPQQPDQRSLAEIFRELKKVA